MASIRKPGVVNPTPSTAKINPEDIKKMNAAKAAAANTAARNSAPVNPIPAQKGFMNPTSNPPRPAPAPARPQGASIPAAVNAMQNAGRGVQQFGGMQNVARGIGQLAAGAPRMGMKKGGKVKRYEEGGLTFADMSDEDRAAQAKARIAEMGGPMPETPKRKAKAVDKGDTRENLRDLDMQGADTGYDATERVRNAKKTQTRHYSGRPGASAEPQVFTPKRKSALPSEQKGMGTFKSGGTVSASRRGDGIAQRGKTKGKVI